MGQSQSVPRYDEGGNTLGARLPPSLSTYAKFVNSQQLSHLPPDSRPQFSHDHHQHFGPAEGVYDCPQKSTKTEDRMGYCFTVRPEDGDIIDFKDTYVADGNQGNEVFRIGRRAHDAHMLTGSEPVIVTKGDVIGILFSIVMFVIFMGVVWGIKWAWNYGVRCRADRKMQDLETRARCVTKSPKFIEKARGRSSSLVKERRGAFCELLTEELKAAVKKHVSESQEREKETSAKTAKNGVPRETYKNGEYQVENARNFDDDSAASSDYEDEDEDWSEVNLEENRAWTSDFNGDLIMLGT